MLISGFLLAVGFSLFGAFVEVCGWGVSLHQTHKEIQSEKTIK